jgi:UDP-N-acetylmuramoyl-tripeptide--D-alanyl-D-alanine ligase
MVVEVGSRGVGHIARLADVIAPDVAVITNIGRAHLETFGDVETVRVAKWELVEALGESGMAVLPAADPALTGMRTAGTITFGAEPDADVRVVSATFDPIGIPTFRLISRGESVDVTLPVPGRHQPLNAAAAAAAALALGRRFTEAAERLATAEISPWRMEVSRIPVREGEVTVVNDAYNANPDSVSSALHTVAGMPGRHIAVLGKMHELGAAEAEGHLEIGRLAGSLGFRVVVVGEDPGIAEGAGRAERVADAREAVSHLRSMVEPGDVVLVKASRAAGLEAIAVALREVAP